MSKTYSKLYKSEEITFKLLRDYPECKNSDGLLYFLYLKHYTELDKSLNCLNWEEVSKSLKSNNLYSPATIIRCRRKLQSKGSIKTKNKHKECIFKILLFKIKKLLRIKEL